MPAALFTPLGKGTQTPERVPILFLIQPLVQTVLFQARTQTETHQLSFHRRWTIVWLEIHSDVNKINK